MLSQGHGYLVRAAGTWGPRALGNEVCKWLMVRFFPGHLKGCTDVRFLIWVATWLSALTAEGQTYCLALPGPQMSTVIIFAVLCTSRKHIYFF